MLDYLIIRLFLYDIAVCISNLHICFQFLKTLRHPNILRFVGCTCVESEVHLVTEHAYPIFVHLKTVDAHEICSGLHDIALALKFIHTQVCNNGNLQNASLPVKGF